MQWKDDVSNDDIETVNASSTTKIQCSSTSSEAVKPSASHVFYMWWKRKEKDKGKVEEVSNGWLKKNQKSNLIMTLPSLYLLLTKPVNIFPAIQPLELIFTCHS